MAKYFLSYRRGTDITAISEGLGQEFGRDNILVDSNFQRGSRIDDLIHDALHGCVAMLPVIDTHWISQVSRLADPLDWVRMEIATALEQKVPLVPLLLDQGRMPRPEDMPAGVRELAYRNGHALDLEAGFKDQIDQLIGHLKLLERGHSWARKRLSEVQALAYGGNWDGALLTCREALEKAHQSFERTQNRVYPLLCNFYELLVALTNALNAFERGHFAHVKVVLDGGRGHEVAHAAYELADIGVAVARALYQRDRRAFTAETHRLERLLNAVEGRWVVPGSVQVGDFVKNGERILSNMDTLAADMDKLAARVAELHEAAVEPYKSQLFRISDTVGRYAPLNDTARLGDPVREPDASLPLDRHVRPHAADDDRHIIEPDRAEDERKPASREDREPSSLEWKRWLWLIGTRAVAGPEPWSPFLAHSWRLVLASLVVGSSPWSPDGTQSWRSLVKWLLTGTPHRSDAEWSWSNAFWPTTSRSVFEEFKEPTRSDELLPEPTLDRLQFTVTAPGAVRPGAEFPIVVWAHETGEQSGVISHARRYGAGALLREAHDSASASLVSIRLQADGLALEQSEQPMTWSGPVVRSIFVARCPRAAPPGMCQIAVDVYVDLLRISRIVFSLEVSDGTLPVDYVPSEETRIKSVFASYAEGDRGSVVARLQRLSQWARGLAVDLTCEERRRAPHWDDTMAGHIKGHELFYLFWSPDALKSDDVEREWQCALAQGGSSFLSAIVVGGDAPPPPALKDVPFYRWDREPAVS